MTETPNLQLPLLVMAQANKEYIHNEALTLIDALLLGQVVDGPIDEPPSDPIVGQSWIVGESALGDWHDKRGHIAVWTEGGWRSILPKLKMSFQRLSDGTILRFDGNVWRLPQLILNATGGSTVDAESRAMLSELLELLQDHGLVKAA